MSTQQADQVIAAICNDCGKRYNVSADKAGKRAKCKVCGNTFTIPAVRPRKTIAATARPEPARAKSSHLPKAKPVIAKPVVKSIPAAKQTVAQPRPTAPRRPKPIAPPPAGDHDIIHALTMSGKVGTGAKGFAQLSRGQQNTRRAADAVVKFMANMWVLLACFAVAAALGCFVQQSSPLHGYAIIGFLALSGLFLLTGLTAVTVAAKLSPTGFVMPWKNFFKVIFHSAGVASMAGVFYLIAYSLRDAPPAGDLDLRLQNHPQMKIDKELPQHLKGHTAH